MSSVYSVQKKAKGEELFDQIMYHLDIVEKDYFGLRFMDSAQVAVRMKIHLKQKSLILLNVLFGYFHCSCDFVTCNQSYSNIHFPQLLIIVSISAAQSLKC